MKREDVIAHLQIIRTWAAFALEDGPVQYDRKVLERTKKWIDEILQFLNCAHGSMVITDQKGNCYCPYCSKPSERARGKNKLTVTNGYCPYCGGAITTRMKDEVTKCGR